MKLTWGEEIESTLDGREEEDLGRMGGAWEERGVTAVVMERICCLWDSLEFHSLALALLRGIGAGTEGPGDRAREASGRDGVSRCPGVREVCRATGVVDRAEEKG